MSVQYMLSKFFSFSSISQIIFDGVFQGLFCLYQITSSVLAVVLSKRHRRVEMRLPFLRELLLSPVASACTASLTAAY